jgi:hypothetical protein
MRRTNVASTSLQWTLTSIQYADQILWLQNLRGGAHARTHTHIDDHLNALTINSAITFYALELSHKTQDLVPCVVTRFYQNFNVSFRVNAFSAYRATRTHETLRSTSSIHLRVIPTCKERLLLSEKLIILIKTTIRTLKPSSDLCT